MKRLLVPLLLAFALTLLPAPSRADEEVEEILFDGFDHILYMTRDAGKIHDVVEVNRNPLFDNAPCLRLRPNDKLVKASSTLGAKGLVEEVTGVYLFSKGKYYELSTSEHGSKLDLDVRTGSLLFDWDVTLANAQALRRALDRGFDDSITIEQYHAIRRAMWNSFPEIKPGIEGSNPSLDTDRMVAIPNQTVFEFQGLMYDEFEKNCIYKYTVKIGPNVFSITGHRMIQGPRHVEREEFEGYHATVLNAAPPHDVDPATAKVKKAEYDRMVKFQELVEKVIGNHGY